MRHAAIRHLPPAARLRSGVPRRSQRGVDDHIHRHQVGHGIVRRSHRAQDSFPGLQRSRGTRCERGVPERRWRVLLATLPPKLQPLQ